MTEPDDSVFDLARDFAEVAHNETVSDDVLTHIPLRDNVTAVARFVSNVRDQLLMRKLEAYLVAVAEAPGEERRAMVKALQLDAEYGRNVGEHVIELLERVESHLKPAMIGHVFAAFARGDINVLMLHRLNDAIERLRTSEVGSMRLYLSATREQRRSLDPESLLALSNAGLLQLHVSGESLDYRPTPTGEKFVALSLDERPLE